MELISPEQMDWWQAFYMLEPWGQPTDDLRVGQMTSAICASQGMEVSPTLIATGRIKTESQTPEEQIAAVNRHVHGHRINAGLE